MIDEPKMSPGPWSLDPMGGVACLLRGGSHAQGLPVLATIHRGVATADARAIAAVPTLIELLREEFAPEIDGSAPCIERDHVMQQHPCGSCRGCRAFALLRELGELP